MVCGTILAAGASIGAWVATRRAEELPVVRSGPHIEGAPLCPWREPEKDRAVLFPGSTGTREETQILSSARLELSRRLGRTPTGDDNALHIYRVEKSGAPMGSVVVRRVRGEYGAIELVIGVRPDGAVQGVRIQRTREPEAIAAILRSPGWLGRFRGLRSEGDWRPLTLKVSSEARASAAAVLDGVRTALILLETADRVGLPAAEHHH